MADQDLEKLPEKELVSGSALPAHRNWLDITMRLATSWVGLFIAYVTCGRRIPQAS